MEKTGKFIISLDFELMWGVRDKKTSKTYGKNILGVWDSLPIMIEQFEKHGIKATFATVGFLFASSKKELLQFCPKKKPNYTDSHISPYNGHFDLLNEKEDRYHFAFQLIDLISKYPNQEIATHTFSHYYCLESGQTKEDFKNDILAAIEIAKSKNIEINSLVFPRNQFNDEYLKIINSLGITSYRGNEKVWFQNAVSEENLSLTKRAFKLLDTYLNISGHNCSSIEDIAQKEPFDIPSSRFLRPYNSKLKLIESLRLRRILNGMTYAAKHRKVYHLWWHPHNFGIDQTENLKFLNKILIHYSILNNKYGFESLTMNDLSQNIKNI